MEESIYKIFYQYLTEGGQRIPDFLFEVNYLSDDELKRMKDIEASAFPEHMQMMNNSVGEEDLTMDDVIEYINDQGLSADDINIYVGSTWYMITHYENGGKELHIDDLAAKGGRFGTGVAFAFISVLSSLMNGVETCHADAREGTSYVMLKDAEKNGRLTILEDDEWDWDGVIMHKVVFKIKSDTLDRLNRRKIVK